MDRKFLEGIREALDGLWEYICRVTSDVSFQGGERGRGGRMLIIVSSPSPVGLAVAIEAERLWAIGGDTNDPLRRVPRDEPLPWGAEGGVVFKDRTQLQFEYFASDVEGRGVTKDTIHLVSSSTSTGLFVGLGEFSHQRQDGKVTTGVVQLRKMLGGSNDFSWAPPGIKPGGDIVQLSSQFHATSSDSTFHRPRPGHEGLSVALTGPGSIIIGDVNGSTIQVQIDEQSTESLQKALEAIRISPEDINAIKAIVAEEKPQGDALGSRAASWVGKMITKSLTGAWRTGKDVTVDVLSGIILRFYGK